MASPYQWNDSYSVNIRIIDQQHQTLFSLINELHDAMLAKKANVVIEKVLAGLVTYTKTHFRDEEAMLAKAKYPELVQHKAIHDGFVAKAADLQQKHKAGSLVLSIETLSFLGSWIRDHILVMDKKYSVYLANK
jgi:hemerythrin-like metal-binding protein